MNYGLTTDGFNIKRLPDIKKDLENAYSDQFGNINLDAESVIGQHIGIMSEVLADLWELADIVYKSFSPNSAEGTSLDEVVSINGITRLSATYTTIFEKLSGIHGTLVPQGLQVRASETEPIFESQIDVTIDNEMSIATRILVDTVTNNETYSVIVNGTDISIDSGGSATKATILNDLKLAIEIETLLIVPSVIDDEILLIETSDYRVPYSIEVSSNLVIELTSSLATCICKEPGSLKAPIYTVNQILTPVTGLSEVINVDAGIIGKNVESDAELRIRRNRSIRIVGAATYSSMLARLEQQVANIGAVKLYENDEDFYDSTVAIRVLSTVSLFEFYLYINEVRISYIALVGGDTVQHVAASLRDITLAQTSFIATALEDTVYIEPGEDGKLRFIYAGPRLLHGMSVPPHSFEVIAMGGLDLDIANKIWEVKPVGINSFGNTSIVVYDSQLQGHLVKFSRPINKYAWVAIELWLNPEEDFPLDGVEAIKDDIVDNSGKNFGIGDDFILQKLYSSIYCVKGVFSSVVSIAISDDPDLIGTLVEVNISIGRSEILVFDKIRIDITIN